MIMKKRIVEYLLTVRYDIAETDRTHIAESLHACADENRFQIMGLIEHATTVEE